MTRGRRAAPCRSRAGERNETGELARGKLRQNGAFGKQTTKHLLAARTAIAHGERLAQQQPCSWRPANGGALRHGLTQGRNRRRRHEASVVAVGTARPLRSADALQEVLHRRRDHPHHVPALTRPAAPAPASSPSPPAPAGRSAVSACSRSAARAAGSAR